MNSGDLAGCWCCRRWWRWRSRSLFTRRDDQVAATDTANCRRTASFSTPGGPTKV